MGLFTRRAPRPEPRAPTYPEMRAWHAEREARREVESWFTGLPYRPAPFRKRDWPPYCYQSGVPPLPFVPRR